MKVLLVFLFVVLGFSLAEGQPENKCELFHTLKASNNLQEARKRLPEDILAKIVCHVKLGTGFDTSVVTQLSINSTTPEVWTLYGLFQLSNHLVCHDGTTPSPNICSISCNDLVDDDISDDIDCLFTITGRLIERGFSDANSTELMRMVRLIFQDECRDENASDFFADC
uniref:alpha-lactalbumin n=1 Tax=Epinephelus lanceolatus TaxID=310571 RepID=UPI0014458112|nr:alpha-lactalbumin [Epinephelus lanceolatus]